MSSGVRVLLTLLCALPGLWIMMGTQSFDLALARYIDTSTQASGAWLRVQVAEGRKREVRRLFEAVDCRVERLVRVRIGPLMLGGLREGEWRRLRPREVAALSGSKRR